MMAPFSTVMEMLRRVRSGRGGVIGGGDGWFPRAVAAMACREGERPPSAVGEGVQRPLRLPLFFTLNQQFFKKMATLGGTAHP